MIAIKDALARSAALGRLYVDFTVTDAPHGSPRLLGSDSNFVSTNVWGGAPVYPVVLSWGGLDKGDIGGSATITFAANAHWVPANTTEKLMVHQWFRELNLRDVAISIYQWSEESTTQSVIWAGYISQMESLRVENGVPVLDLLCTASLRDMELTPASDLIEAATFTTAPTQSLGLMVPLNYGDIPNRIFSGASRNSVGMIGHPMNGVRGVMVAEGVLAPTVIVRFAKHDGTSAAQTFSQPTPADEVFQTAAGADQGRPVEGDLWIYDSTLGAYGMVENNSWDETNTTSVLQGAIGQSPRVYFFIRPSKSGSTTSSGFANNINKLVNADIHDYLESTDTDYIWSFECPEVPMLGTVKNVWVMVDWANVHGSETRQIQFGLWDVFGSAGAAYLDGQSNTKSRSITDPLGRLITGNIDPYYAWHFRTHNGVGTSTQAEFRSGRFVTRGTADGNEATLQLRVEVNDLGAGNAGRDGVRIYHLILVVEVEYPTLPTFNTRPWLAAHRQVPENFMGFDTSGIDAAISSDEQTARRQFKVDQVRAKADVMSRIRGTDFFATGAFQKDDGSGTYSGAPGLAIERPCDIAHHMLHKHWGKTRNATAGTLGNFVDARTTVLANINMLASFGPDEVKRAGCIDSLNSTMPMSVFEEDKVWQCIPDDMNPHSSRLYRSSSEIVTIGPEDIERDSFVCPETSPRDIINSVMINYGHGYPDREAGLTISKDHKLSQMYFGKKNTPPIDAPFLINKQYDTAPNTGATAYAEWQVRRFARPRLRPSMKLTQKFYDLRRGHIVELRNLEDVGIYNPAFRCGLLDYYFKSATDTVNQADSLTPAFVQVGSTSQIYIGFSQQVEQITAYVATAAAYTTPANNWKYSNTTSTFTAFGDANTVNKDGLKSTGTQTISWTRPPFTSWGKQELSFGAFGVAGPCYWVSMDYTGAGTAGAGNYRTGYPGTWYGRGFEVLKASRVPSGDGDYMAMGVQLREIM